MKRYVLLFILVFFTLPCLSQISTSNYINGYWGQWTVQYGARISGSINNFVLHPKYAHPSAHSFKVVITNYSTPNKKEVKSHWKNKEWYQYSGYVEYYLDDTGTTELFVRKFPWCGFSISKGYSKKVSKAIIKIAPYKKLPRVYNIWFEGYAVGIQLY